MNSHSVYHSITRQLKENRFLLLLVVLVVYISVDLHLSRVGTGGLAETTLVSFVLLAAIGCLQFKTRGIVTTRWFGVFTLLSGWVPLFIQAPMVYLAVSAFRIGFLLIVTAALIYQVASSKRVSFPIIIGAVDGYLMLGLIGAVGFAVAELLFPGSVRFASPASPQSDLLYFAFITMLTVGYGEILPVGSTAKTIAVFLAAGGQLYIAILVAMLVGKFLAADQAEGREG